MKQKQSAPPVSVETGTPQYPESVTRPELLRAMLLIDQARRIVFDSLDYLEKVDVVDRRELSDALLANFCDLEDNIGTLLRDRLVIDIMEY